ncbi:OPT oligopeptide transporter protein-domain-containing protein [Scleroderma yunnanense]
MQADTPVVEISLVSRTQDPEVGGEEDLNDEADVVGFKGDTIIKTGKDVSHFLVDLRDDGDPALTFRSLVIGTLLACIGAANTQVLPQRSMVKRTRFSALGPVLEFINHGEFRIKEHAIAMSITATASFTFDTTPESRAAVQQLYYNTTVHAMTPILASLSIAGFGPENHKRLKLFKASFVGIFLWEIIPSYIFPLLNGLSIFCLASQHIPSSAQDVFTNLFGGASNNEGLGILSISLPLIQQANSWVGYGLGYIVLCAIYYFNIWNSKSFPMSSMSMFYSNGSVFDLSVVLGTTFQVNQTALTAAKFPHMTGSNMWYHIASNLSIGGLFAHCLCFWGQDIKNMLKNAHLGIQPDPHWKGQTTISWHSYIVALLLGSFVTPFSQLFYAQMGTGIATKQLMEMIGGFLDPGKPVTNLYFTMLSHGIIVQCITFSAGLKVCQYLEVPPQATFLAQIWGTFIVVMMSIVDSQKTALLNSNGKSIWNGVAGLYGVHDPYFIILISLVCGFVATIIQWCISKMSTVILPIIYMMSYGETSFVTSAILVGIISQFWLRKYHPGLFRKYNYIFGAALDAGSQAMSFILSFVVFGAFGQPRPFPAWAGNPSHGNTDYCNGNSILT